jgi:hypothetical protein
MMINVTKSQTLFPVSTHLTLPRSRWLAFASQPDQGEAFWRSLSALRRHGLQAALYTALGAQAPPWSVLSPGGRWHGLLLWPNDPMAMHWMHMARQLGIAVRWVPALTQEAGDS